jgi:uncharacterized protein
MSDQPTPSAASGRDVPTVVVARNVKPGREREFERWVRRLVAASEAAPGHLDASVEPPNEAHPDEWVVVYRFADTALLHAWLSSPARQKLIETGADLIDGEAREQVVALAADHEPVTAVISVRVTPGREAGYRVLHERLVERLTGFDGFRRCELLEPVAGVQDDTVTVLSFDERDHLDAWLTSPEREEILVEMEPLVDGTRTVNVVGGFAGWFAPGFGADVKRWKQAATVLLALFPTTLLITLVREAVAPDLAVVPAVFIGNVLGVAALSWLLMPTLTRWLDPWLRR